ncbi:efflux system membrane protein [compost metagenome]
MPREIALFGVYLPNLTLLFVITLAVGWGIDRLVAWSGLYRHAWHPTLLRVSLFTCLYGALMLYVYH